MDEYSEHSFTDLLGPNSINDRVEHWWNNYIKIGQKNMNVSRNILAKAMCHEREKSWGIKGQNYTDMGTTGAERLESRLVRGETENRMENVYVRESNGYDVKPQDSNGPQTIYVVDLDVCTGQASKTHVLAVCVWDDMVSAKGQSQDEEYKRENSEERSPNYSKTNNGYCLVSKNCAIMERVTDSYIAVISHGKKDY